MRSLILDMGNTRLKWGVYQGGQWSGNGACLNSEAEGALERVLERWLPLWRVAAVRVGPQATARLVERLCRGHALPLSWITSQVRFGGVENSYRPVSSLGADRWAAMVAVRGRCQGPCLVIGAGTATTIDALDRHGCFLGGVIVPGLQLLVKALQRGTFNLRAADTDGEYAIFPTTTSAAMVSGALAATLGAIERQRRELQRRAPAIPVTLWLNGGNGAALVPHLPPATRLEPDLVLEGAALLMEHSE